jgi:AAA domain, putative AbiEii toxin, Type IV TA system
MLLSFRVVNHRSLRDEQHLNLAPAFEADRPPGTHWPAVPVAGILGANASGKSNLIDALAFMRRMVLRSDREGEPGQGVSRSPFALDPDFAAQASWYDADAVINGVRYTYGFGLDDRQVVEEWLHRYPKGRKQLVFERKDGQYKFGTTIDDNLRRMVGITPDRVLFISSSARFEQSDVLAFYRWMSNIRMASELRSTPVHDERLHNMLSAESQRREVCSLLQFADLGIADIFLEEADVPEYTARNRAQWFEQAIREGNSFVTGVDKENGRSLPKVLPAVRFRMKGTQGAATLSLEQQSAGTRTFLSHLPDVLDCLREGSPLVVDELESNLHPNLARHVLGLFQDSHINPLGAQLILTTHNTSLLSSNNEYLKRDQVWFVEKNHENGASVLYPLSDFKPRDKENTERRYLGGSYGAVPSVDDSIARKTLPAMIAGTGEQA